MNAVLQQPRKRKAIKPTLPRAEYLLSSGDPLSASVCSRSILREDASQIGALEVLAKAQWQLSQYSDLLVTLRTLIRLNPYEPGYHALRGAVYQALGNTGEAIKCFARDESATASASIEELREWQSSLIATLLQEDTVFRTHYAQDPEEAGPVSGVEILAHLRHGGSVLGHEE